MSRNLIIIGVVVVLLIGGVVLLLNNRPSSTANVSPTPTVTPLSTTPSPMMKKTVKLPVPKAENATQSGEIVFEEDNGKTTATLTTTGGPTDTPQPAHIHIGMCPKIGAVKYPLTNVVNGNSSTVLDITIDTIMSQLPLAVNVHKSTTEPNIYVSCGNISKDS